MSLPEPNAVELLRGAVSDPLTRQSSSDRVVTKWYELAREKAPLWTFNKSAFCSLRTDDLPSSFPLRRIIKTIAEDEDVDLDRQDQFGRSGQLLSYVYGIRVGWSRGKTTHPWVYRSSGGQLGFAKYASVGEVRSIPDMDTDDPYESPIWYLGMEVLSRLEDVEAASTKKVRRKARKELDIYLDSLGARLSQGRPAKGATKQILDALFEQGKWLFGVCWAALPAEPSAEALGILQKLGVAEDEHSLWALRLALPMLSAVEIKAMEEERAKPLGRRAAHTAPRRFAVFSIAHRLGVKAQALSCRLPPRSDAKEFFRNNLSPIRR